MASIFVYKEKDIAEGGRKMSHIKVLARPNIRRGDGTGCGECKVSCQSACKTSCTVANQSCRGGETKVHRPTPKTRG